MRKFNLLSGFAVKYNYDPNHNLRYLELAALIVEHDLTNLLILGCGKGILEYLLPNEIRCTSIDINSNEIEIAKMINFGKTNRTFIASDLFNLPHDYENRYQAVIVSEVIEHIEDDKAVLNLASKYLKPIDGIFILTVPNIDRLENRLNPLIGRKALYMSEDHLREYSFDSICESLASCGFDTFRSKHVYLRLPKELLVRKLIPLDSRFRGIFLSLFPSLATYIILLSTHK